MQKFSKGNRTQKYKRVKIFRINEVRNSEVRLGRSLVIRQTLIDSYLKNLLCLGCLCVVKFFLLLQINAINKSLERPASAYSGNTTEKGKDLDQ